MSETSSPPPEAEARPDGNFDDTILEVIVVALTVLTALVAFLAVRADDESSDLELEAQRVLNEADVEEAKIDRSFDELFRVVDEFNVAEPDSVAEEYYGILFEDLVADLTGDSGVDLDSVDPFSDDFNDLAYEEADSLLDESEELFEAAAIEGGRALDYQAALLAFAVGLSFAAWGSLAHPVTKRRTRRLFMVLSIAALIAGTIQLLAV